ncbi:MAG: 4Fe-4S dicluster domain-containing protein [Chlorobi bacterium]|nr:4Fe-4S dicluster domain-containing protein [Chlorobiota bacterium]
MAMRRVANMGKAVITDPQQCLAYHGKGYSGPLGKHHALLRPPGSKERIDIAEVHVEREICDLCVAYCPLGSEAIELKEIGNGKYLPEIKDGCVGCGVCQMLCPTDPKAIVVEPREKLA